MRTPPSIVRFFHPGRADLRLGDVSFPPPRKPSYCAGRPFPSPGRAFPRAGRDSHKSRRLLRPFRAGTLFCQQTQGVALGWLVAHLRRSERRRPPDEGAGSGAYAAGVGACAAGFGGLAGLHPSSVRPSSFPPAPALRRGVSCDFYSRATTMVGSGLGILPKKHGRDARATSAVHAA